MKERGILFTAEMVGAILDDRKTMTRRLLQLPKRIPKEQHADYKQVHEDGGGNWIAWSGDLSGDMATFTKKAYPKADGFPCPYGKRGDRLYVKETWADVNTESGPGIAYKAGGIHFCADDAYPVDYNLYPGMTFTMWYGDLLRGEPEHKWRSPLFMPRWASRITLEITDIRTERLQEITEADILSEGVTADRAAKMTGIPWSDLPTLHHAWIAVWDHINYDRAPYESNPLVLVLTFRRVESAQQQEAA